MTKHGWILVLALTLVGCPGGDDEVSATELCNALADAQCARMYECYSTDEREEIGLPSTVSACKSTLRSEFGCAAANDDDLCEGNEKFYRQEAESCQRQVNAASCGQIRNDDDFAPACDRICRVE